MLSNWYLALLWPALIAATTSCHMCLNWKGNSNACLSSYFKPGDCASKGDGAAVSYLRDSSTSWLSSCRVGPILKNTACTNAGSGDCTLTCGTFQKRDSEDAEPRERDLWAVTRKLSEDPAKPGWTKHSEVPSSVLIPIMRSVKSLQEYIQVLQSGGYYQGELKFQELQRYAEPWEGVEPPLEMLLFNCTACSSCTERTCYPIAKIDSTPIFDCGKFDPPSCYDAKGKMKTFREWVNLLGCGTTTGIPWACKSQQLDLTLRKPYTAARARVSIPAPVPKTEQPLGGQVYSAQGYLNDMQFLQSEKSSLAQIEYDKFLPSWKGFVNDWVFGDRADRPPTMAIARSSDF